MGSTWDNKYFHDIASELKMIRKVLERIAQASIFETPKTLTFKEILDDITESDIPQEKQTL